jgi:hypothetical protein
MYSDFSSRITGAISAKLHVLVNGRMLESRMEDNIDVRQDENPGSWGWVGLQ